MSLNPAAVRDVKSLQPGNLPLPGALVPLTVVTTTKEGKDVRTPTKLAAITAAVAMTVPVGIAQATHDEGQEGAPGQVCKEMRQNNKSALKAFMRQNPRPSNAAIKAMRMTQHQEYKDCIKAAAEARTEDQ